MLLMNALEFDHRLIMVHFVNSTWTSSWNFNSPIYMCPQIMVCLSFLLIRIGLEVSVTHWPLIVQR